MPPAVKQRSIGQFLGDLTGGAGAVIAEGETVVGNIIDVNTNGIADNSPTQPRYDFTYRVFPENLGTQGYNGHYMVININVSDMSKMGNGSLSLDGKAINTWTTLSGQSSKLDVYRFNIDRRYSGQGGGAQNSFGVPRFTTRIAESIALFMPETVQYSNRNDYAELDLLSTLSGPLDAVAAGVGAAARAVGPALAYGGLSINPRVEVQFRNTQLREFTFEFLFSPTTQKESDTIEEIIRTLRVHQAPEINPLNSATGASGLARAIFYVKPSEFDITFYYRGKENTHIPRIMTCACIALDVDYAPSGTYSTFRNGAAVHTKMMVTFRELEINHRLRVLQGF